MQAKSEASTPYLSMTARINLLLESSVKSISPLFSGTVYTSPPNTMVAACVVVSGAGEVVGAVVAGAVVVAGTVVAGAVVDSVSCAPQPLNNRQTKRPLTKSFLQPFKISLLKKAAACNTPPLFTQK